MKTLTLAQQISFVNRRTFQKTISFFNNQHTNLALTRHRLFTSFILAIKPNMMWSLDLTKTDITQNVLNPKFKTAIPWKYFKFVDVNFYIRQTLISKPFSLGWLPVCWWYNLLYRTKFNFQMDASGPFHWALADSFRDSGTQGGTHCLWSCYQCQDCDDDQDQY